MIIKTDKGTIRANNATCDKHCQFMIVWNPNGLFGGKHQCLLSGETLKKTKRAFARCDTCLSAEREWRQMLDAELKKVRDIMNIVQDAQNLIVVLVEQNKDIAPTIMKALEEVAEKHGLSIK